ncbi:MAG TPA: CPBP family intramembrane glutamic endopeptidase [Mycobacterium sp.]|uniref:CPBP family intramembrane glutamic endopeptidase n=1 Tax=Mycobacterium sp. TaxID=1785 RepID=UPI002CE267E0|nr:CPBP family intramembrane glutamic endopeptidase [Mycobacterium sp.]HME74154.1 CPBP family intramembrane glutamic endopeptidase [Mycobacterium sp.]
MTSHNSALGDIRRGIVNVAVPHNEPPSVKRRRRIVVAIVLLLGAGVLGLALRRHPGESSFYWLSLTLAAVWAFGSFASGPLHLGGLCWRGRNQRPVISGTVIGLLLGAVFVLGGLIAREIPAVSELITRVLQYADQGPWRLTMAIALVGGIAEELFYRGALYTALGRYHPALVSTVVYVAATLASGNLMLAFAAIVLGTVCALERRATGGVMAPILTHFVWTVVVLLALPPLFGL